MGRPLTGTIEQLATCWRAALPAAPGTRQRHTEKFATEAEARDWRDAAVEARLAGLPLPDADDFRTPTVTPDVAAPAVEQVTAPVAAAASVPGHVPAVAEPVAFRAAGERYLAEHYTRGRNGGPTRHKAEADLIAKIADYLEDPDVDIAPGTLTREQYVHLIEQWSGAQNGPLNKRQPQGAGPDAARGYAQSVIKNHRATLDRVLRYAWTVLDQPQQFDPTSYTTPKTDAVRKQPKRPLTLAETAAAAVHLHAVFQLVLWLLRLGGMRISETYGLHIKDVLDFPDGSGRGLLVIRRQGGTGFLERGPDGEPVVVSEVNRTKTPWSVRLVPVPADLVLLIDQVIKTFHTGPDGAIDPDARLIPDLGKKGSGQSSFRRALKLAAKASGLDVSSDLFDGDALPIPHDMRAGLNTTLADTDLPEWARMRYLGHVPGQEVHHRHYLLDDPKAAPLLKIADLLQAQIETEVPAGLMVPTTRRCTTGVHKVLASRGPEIDASLLEAGWLVGHLDDGLRILDSTETADLLDRAESTVRRWLRDGTLPSRPLPGGRADQRGATLADVQRLADDLAGRLTMADLAEELGWDLRSLHGVVRRQDLTLDIRGNIALVPEPAAEALRAWVTERRRLAETACGHAEAARTLGVDVRAIPTLVQTGQLTAVESTDGTGRYVTHDSVDTLAATRRRRRRGTPAAVAG